MAQRRAPPSEPAKRWFLRPSAMGRMACRRCWCRADAAVVEDAANGRARSGWSASGLRGGTGLYGLPGSHAGQSHGHPLGG